MKSTIRKILRNLGWVLAILGALPVLFYIVLVLVNLNDDPLSPDVEKLLNTAPPAIEANSNGYFAWIGIRGPENEHPHAWGQRWFNDALKNDKLARTSMKPVPHPLEKEVRQQKTEKTPCDQLEICLESVAAHPEVAREVLKNEKVTLDRANLALLYSAYQEAWRPDFSVTSVFQPPPYQLHTLSATRFALSVAEGHHTEALEQLGWEMAFFKRQLQGSRGLVEKLIGMAQVRNYYLLLSQYMRRHPVEAVTHAEQIQNMLAALPDEAVSLKPCLESEMRVTALVILDLNNNKSNMPLPVLGNDIPGEPTGTVDYYLSQLTNLAFRQVFLVNHTINENATRFNALIRAENLKGEAYRQALAEASRPEQQQIFPFRLRNPIGHILVNVATPAYAQYYLRRDDLLALRSTVEFQLKVLRQVVIDGDKIAEILKTEQENLRHPYSGAVPAWNKETRQLSYPLVDDTQKNKQVVIQL